MSQSTSEVTTLWDKQFYFSKNFPQWVNYHNLFYDLKIIWQLPRHVFNLWNMFSIIETTPLSAIHFLIILPQSVNGVINPLTPTNDQDRISPYIIRTISSRQVMRMKKKYQLRDYCNFCPSTSMADYPHQSFLQ